MIRICDGLLTSPAVPQHLHRDGTRIGHVPSGAGAVLREAAIARRLYYRDSYGRAHRDRQAEKGSSASGVPAFLVVKILLVFAVIVLFASLVS
jgi:hypothetical protein